MITSAALFLTVFALTAVSTFLSTFADGRKVTAPLALQSASVSPDAVLRPDGSTVQL